MGEEHEREGAPPSRWPSANQLAYGDAGDGGAETVPADPGTAPETVPADPEHESRKGGRGRG